MLVNGRVFAQTFHTADMPIARREWRCALCNRFVKLNERYVRYAWRQEHKIDTLRYHPECWAIIRAYCKANDVVLFDHTKVRRWIKTLPPCRRCSVEKCNRYTCQRILRNIRYKPRVPKWETVKSMDDNEAGEGFEILDK